MVVLVVTVDSVRICVVVVVIGKKWKVNKTGPFISKIEQNTLGDRHIIRNAVLA